MPTVTPNPFSNAEGAAIPKYNPLARNNTGEPQRFSAAAGTAKTIYDESAEEPCDRIYVHNVSTAPAYYAKNQAATVDVWHDLLAGESNAGDGLGTKVTFDVRRDGIKSISMIAPASPGLNVAVEKIRLPTGSRIQNVTE